MKLIIDIPEYLYKSLLEYKKKGGLQITQVENCIINGTPIPDNATNSDIMLTIFPDETDLHTFARHNKVVWWNAPYQKGGKE